MRDEHREAVRFTDEGGQELRPRSELGARELLREVGAVLRMSETEAASPGREPPGRSPATTRR